MSKDKAIPSLNQVVHSQLGASIDTLENAINLCPEDLWDNELNFWYWSYHCIFWLDFYLTMDSEQFHPPPPFTMSEFDSDGAMPPKTYNKEEILSYLNYCREKARNLLADFTVEKALSPWKNKRRSFTTLEITMYNMRHVQHHAAQLNQLLRQNIDDAPKWVSKGADSLKS